MDKARQILERLQFVVLVYEEDEDERPIARCIYDDIGVEATCGGHVERFEGPTADIQAYAWIAGRLANA